ncbi:hypothetical protein EDB89DRAFT_1822233, partial [Lactarius sanguifluus]
DKAAQYLAVYKQSEHYPPMLICVRVFKIPGAVLRTVFVSIPPLSFETLRTSF